MIFYAHNFGKYDGLQIIKDQIGHGFFIEQIKRDTTILSIIIKYENKTIKLQDSLAILPGSLENIAKEFNIQEKKGDFPYLFVNEGASELNKWMKPKFGITFNRSQMKLPIMTTTYNISTSGIQKYVSSIFNVHTQCV